MEKGKRSLLNESLARVGALWKGIAPVPLSYGNHTSLSLLQSLATHNKCTINCKLHLIMHADLESNAYNQVEIATASAATCTEAVAICILSYAIASISECIVNCDLHLIAHLYRLDVSSGCFVRMYRLDVSSGCIVWMCVWMYRLDVFVGCVWMYRLDVSQGANTISMIKCITTSHFQTHCGLEFMLKRGFEKVKNQVIYF